MVQPKQKPNEGPNGEADADNDKVEGAEDNGAAKESVAAAPKPVAKKGASAKEVIPFKWKLVGDAQGMILTLFKAVEREEVESQLDRIRREGYYANLRILDADEKIKQSAAAKSVLMRAREGKPKTPKKAGKDRGKPARAVKAGKATPAGKVAKAAPRTKAGMAAKATKATEVSKAAKTRKAGKTAKTTKVGKVAKVEKKTKAKATATAKATKSAKPKTAAKTKKKKATSTKTRKKRTTKTK